MRLVDADALAVQIRDNVFHDFTDEFWGVMQCIGEAPTIEPERKKGKWIPLQVSLAHPPYQCSCCFRNAPMVETGCLMNRHLEALLTDFCPNCGARMELEDIPMEYFESGRR